MELEIIEEMLHEIMEMHELFKKDIRKKIKEKIEYKIFWEIYKADKYIKETTSKSIELINLIDDFEMRLEDSLQLQIKPIVSSIKPEKYLTYMYNGKIILCKTEETN